MNSIGIPASLCAHSAKNGIRIPSAAEAAKNRNMPTWAARGARAKVVAAEMKILKNRFTSWLQQRGSTRRPARMRRPSVRHALADVNAYGAAGAHSGPTTRPGTRQVKASVGVVLI